LIGSVLTLQGGVVRDHELFDHGRGGRLQFGEDRFDALADGLHFGEGVVVGLLPDILRGAALDGAFLEVDDPTPGLLAV
jgi:hypothetical protein